MDFSPNYRSSSFLAEQGDFDPADRSVEMITQSIVTLASLALCQVLAMALASQGLGIVSISNMRGASGPPCPRPHVDV